MISEDGKINILKTSILKKINYMFAIIPIKVPTLLLIEIKRIVFSFI